jgi:hypothetical protein
MRSRVCLGLLLIALGGAVAIADDVPLPRPKPKPAAAEPAGPPAFDPAKPNEAATPPGPSACELRLAHIAVALSQFDIEGQGGCIAQDVVRLDAILMPDKTKVAVTPPAIMRCEMAEAVAGYIREDAGPAISGLGSKLARVENFDSFSCRGRNRVFGAKLSEHGKANALDIRFFKLANGVTLTPTDMHADKPVREALRQAACGRFKTVLGPGSDGYHEDHIHLDLAERRGGYKMCQWEVRVPPPPKPPEAKKDDQDDAKEAEAEDAPDGVAVGQVSDVPLPRPRPVAARVNDTRPEMRRRRL